MTYYRYALILAIAALLVGCAAPAEITEVIPSLTPTVEPTVETVVVEEAAPYATPTAEFTPTPTATPDPFASLYGCEMQITFESGPLENEETAFEVLGLDYFIDKGDKFGVGKGTAIFYEEQQYFILHSSYVNGNILRPMEAEFLRKYLEHWGTTDTDYIQGQIDNLTGSQVTWNCNGEEILSTRINGIVRLSHAASDTLWLEPRMIETILDRKEGLVSEWVGGIGEMDEQTLLVGFCGWGPASLESGRYTYYRYLISFEVLN